MLVNEIHEKTTKELVKLVHELKLQLFAIRFQSVTGKLDSPHRFKLLRKDIARILTILKIREKNGEKIDLKFQPPSLEKIQAAEKNRQDLEKEKQEKMMKALEEGMNKAKAVDSKEKTASKSKQLTEIKRSATRATVVKEGSSVSSKKAKEVVSKPKTTTVKPAAKKTTTAKPAVKKVAAKPVAKKTTTKKPVAKESK